eukprot:11037768-Alexandrium_andersonii.AAC.1
MFWRSAVGSLVLPYDLVSASDTVGELRSIQLGEVQDPAFRNCWKLPGASSVCLAGVSRS